MPLSLSLTVGANQSNPFAASVTARVCRAQFWGQFSLMSSSTWIQGWKTLSQFAEDTELGRAAASLEGRKASQRDLNRLEGRALAAT